MPGSIYTLHPTQHIPDRVRTPAGGGPERLRLLMEGEALLNDASGITLFTIFLKHVEDLIQGAEGHNTFWTVLGNIIGRTAWLGGSAPRLPELRMRMRISSAAAAPPAGAAAVLAAAAAAAAQRRPARRMCSAGAGT